VYHHHLCSFQLALAKVPKVADAPASLALKLLVVSSLAWAVAGSPTVS
jgi:hypothetical protein